MYCLDVGEMRFHLCLGNDAAKTLSDLSCKIGATGVFSKCSWLQSNVALH